MPEPGPLLAAGRSAEIFEYGPSLVLRRYRRPGVAGREAAVIAHVRAHGFPAPAVHEVADDVLVMDRVRGPSMLEDMARRPWSLLRHARTLASLHRRVHAIPGPDWLHAPYGPGTSLLHFDLHPGNVLLGPDGPVVIDWEGAVRGPAEADVAQTWILIATSHPEGSLAWRTLQRMARDQVVRAFLAGFDLEAVVDVLPAVAEARKADRNVMHVERAAIDRLVRRVVATGAPPRRPRRPGAPPR
jgi:aminoglycoside phosphotransferase (APT) family kinase protein